MDKEGLFVKTQNQVFSQTRIVKSYQTNKSGSYKVL